MMRPLASISAALVLLFATATANAVVIDFSSLSGTNGDPFTATTEVGFDVASVAGDWNEAHVFGNPTPSIFTSGNITHTVLVTVSGGGTFTLDTVDFGCGLGAADDCTGTVEGLLSGGTEFLVSTALLANDGTFSTFDPSVGGVTIDALRISLNRGDSNIDNIVVDLAAVPAPATLVLAALGLVGVGATRRRIAS